MAETRRSAYTEYATMGKVSMKVKPMILISVLIMSMRKGSMDGEYGQFILRFRRWLCALLHV